VAQDGQITLPARLLADYVALLDHGGKVALDLNPKTHKVHLACGRYEANIAGIDAEDFPPIPAVDEGGARFSMVAGALKEAISQVVFAAAPDDSRPVLAGVLMRLSGGQLTLAAADGFRLAVRHVELSQSGEDVQMIVPARALSEVARLLPSEEGAEVSIALTASGNQVFFAFGKTELTSRLIEGQFPDYQRIIPADSKTQVKLSTHDFLRATRAAAVFARDNSNIVRLECTPSEEDAELALGRVMVKSTSAEMGDNEGHLDASVNGDAVQIAFNGKYLRDALEVIETPDVTLQITGPSSPGIIRPSGGPNGYLHVIMPMHVAR
jgi:DNA polymerase-3 subunit beta